MPFKPYCKMHTGDNIMIDVVYQCDKDVDSVLVHFEKPDDSLCFKVFEYALPEHRIVKNLGYSNFEVAQLIDFCKHNAAILLSSEVD